MRPAPDALPGAWRTGPREGPGAGPAPVRTRPVTPGQPQTVLPRQRLHPLSPLLHSAKALAFMVAAISWQGLGQLGLGRWAVLVTMLLCGAVVVSVISWLVTGYEVTGRELRIQEGVLWRRSRSIPLERLQAVEVVQPALARATGLAELRLEVVGGAKTEAPLAYLSRPGAMALRETLLRLAAPARAAAGAEPAAGTGTTAAPPAAGPAPARLLHRVSNEDVVTGQLLTPQMWFVPIAAAMVLFQFAFAGALSLIAIASTLTALIGVLQHPVRGVLRDWDFRVATDAAGLRVRHGLVETRSQTVPLNRVQAVGAVWPLLWRPKRWLRLRLDVAGYAGAERSDRPADHLLPVGDLATARALLPAALPGVDLAALPVTGPPPRARWLAPLRAPVLGVGLTGQVVITRDGPLTRRLVIVPYARIQSVRVVRGPLQRMLGLATVHVDTAGGLRAVAHHRDAGEAWGLAAELTERARAARQT